MTDFLESVLNSMSSAFNSSPTPADGSSIIDVNLNEDKTLKWRTLHNNSNALKSNKKNCGEVIQQQQEKMSTNSQGYDSNENCEDKNEKCDEIHVKTESISTNVSGEDRDQQKIVNTRRRKNLRKEVEKTTESSASPSRRTRRSHPIESTLNNNNTAETKIEVKPKRRGRSKKIPFETTSEENSCKKTNEVFENENEVNDSEKITATISPTATELKNNTIKIERQQSPTGRKLRRSERNSMPEDIKIEKDAENSLKTTNDNNNSEPVEIKSKRTRRSERIGGSKCDVEDTVNMIPKTPIVPENIEIKEELKKSPEVEFPTSSIDTNENVDINQETNLPPSTNDVTPKKRGRRMKTKSDTSFLNSTSPKRSRNVTKENKESSLTNASSNQKEKPNEPLMPPPIPITLVPQRPLRRIKPTAKILENDELRYEFETKNIARITACTDLQQSITNSTLSLSPPTSLKSDSAIESIISGSKNKKEQKEDETNKYVPKSKKQSSSSSSSSLSSTSSVKSKKTRHFNIGKIKSRVFPSSSSSLSLPSHSRSSLQTEKNLNVDNIYPVILKKPCPDPQTFLNEIKAAKINLHKSPENGKLNPKQHRKLLKQKEKHFEKLGLRRNVDKGNKSDTDESLSDNEEFVPPKRLNVGKPNVTLRLRNKENSPAPSSTLSKNQQQQGKSKIIQRKRISTVDRSKLSKIVTSTSTSAALAREIIETNQPLQPSIPSHHKDTTKEQQMICLCQKPSQYYTQNTPETAYCCAIDSMEDQKVGCCNPLNGELLNLLRPSHRVGYMILCDDHKKRLLAHNCCASCGIFCTQGKFILCKKEHFFHAECAQKYILNTPYDPTNTITTYPSPVLVLKCPHCGCDTPEKTSLVTMNYSNTPVFSTSQKILMPAKMTVPESNNECNKIRHRPQSVLELDKLIPESVINIISRGSDDVYTTHEMFCAVSNDDVEQVAEIIASGYDITSEIPEFLSGTCLHVAANYGAIQSAYLLLSRELSENYLNMRDNQLRTAVMCAVIRNKCNVLKLFIQFGADLAVKNSEGMTCLHISAKLGNIKATRLIVENYKNSTNVMNFKKFLDAQDYGGWTAMVWAAENGHTEIVSYLISNGADPNVCDLENNTVLHWATISDHVETIMALLQTNINCNQQNVLGDTPLHCACRTSNSRICLMLIAHGADLMVKNNSDELPYDCIPEEDSQCARAVGFNMQMRTFGPTGLRNKIIYSDISNGRELHPIQAVRSDRYIKSRNQDQDQDDEIILPDFKYITKSILLQNSIQIDQRVSQMRVCSCNDGCNSDSCQCSTISLQSWYTPEGRLNDEFCYENPPVIFECNDVCGCNKLMCRNRVVQNGIKIPLQVFECDQRLKGWGVRSLISIERGTFISEYTGEILTDIEADRRTDDSYFFDLGASDHCIDANYYGNISRFYNHSCSPNIVPVRVYYEHQDYRFPKIAFFTCKEVTSGEELCFDYGDKFWAVKQKHFPCQCKSVDCRYNNNRKFM